ncbi:hypothetical protein [Streptomyces sp. MK7]|uniref:hypothetical protein n=1 Tax=Streptomyces sp. MK7 TaxID=3067635 RepID=UPI00292EF5D1|nr:hypothetical protein [Streptomyces sp. MK7]
MARAHQAQYVDPYAAIKYLRSALSRAGTVLPSPAVDVGSPALGLVELGRVRADVAIRRAEGLRRGGDA